MSLNNRILIQSDNFDQKSKHFGPKAHLFLVKYLTSELRRKLNLTIGT